MVLLSYVMTSFVKDKAIYLIIIYLSFDIIRAEPGWIRLHLNLISISVYPITLKILFASFLLKLTGSIIVAAFITISIW